MQTNNHLQSVNSLNTLPQQILRPQSPIQNRQSPPVQLNSLQPRPQNPARINPQQRTIQQQQQQQQQQHRPPRLLSPQQRTQQNFINTQQQQQPFHNQQLQQQQQMQSIYSHYRQRQSPNSRQNGNPNPIPIQTAPPSQQQNSAINQFLPFRQQLFQNLHVQTQQQLNYVVRILNNNALTPRPLGLDINYLKDAEIFREFLDNFADKDNYLCQICHNILWETTTCKQCHKNFCIECIQYWLQSNQSCPCCREFFQHKRTDTAITQNLNRLKFECQNEGCTQKPPYEFLLKHQNECEFMLMSCKNEGCDYEKKRQDYGNHENECPHQILPCKWCGTVKLKRMLIEDHENTCDLKIIRCSNEDCTEKLPKLQFEQHEQNCPHKMQLCQQCNKEYKQKDLLSHRNDCEFNELKCRGCNQTFFKKDIEDHENKCPELEIQCESCSSKFLRKQQGEHSELVCLRFSNQELLKFKNQSEQVIKGLCNDKENLYKQIDHLKQCMASLYDLVQSKKECVCPTNHSEQQLDTAAQQNS